MSQAVIGLGFGDEGKGLTTDLLSSETNYQALNKMVVRYSGGQQAGHTVVKEDHRHVFSTFGSGTFRGVPTFWTRFCTVDPVEIVAEMQKLKDLDFQVPILFIDPNCPVTTPHDKMFQQNDDENMEHGTCGFGVGSTFQREEDFFHLLARDIWNPTILRMKYDQLKEHYYKGSGVPESHVRDFYKACRVIRDVMNIKLRQFDSLEGHDLIFEGSQGLLLDQHIGFFPNVTRANTGSRNILQMGYKPEVYAVTRAYQTRHGNGPITNLDRDYDIMEDEMETNKTNDFQGEFKRSMLDLDLLYHGISSDPYIAQLHAEKKLNLVVTCLDHLHEYSFTMKGERYNLPNKENFVGEIGRILGAKTTFVSESPESKNIVKL